MIIFRSSEGRVGYHQTEGVDDALQYVERLRNTEGVEQVRLFRMDEVSFEFRTYYKAELAGAAPAEAPTEQPAPQEQEGLVPEPELVDEDRLATNGRRRLGR